MVVVGEVRERGVLAGRVAVSLYYTYVRGDVRGDVRGSVRGSVSKSLSKRPECTQLTKQRAALVPGPSYPSSP